MTYLFIYLKMLYFTHKSYTNFYHFIKSCLKKSKRMDNKIQILFNPWNIRYLTLIYLKFLNSFIKGKSVRTGLWLYLKVAEKTAHSPVDHKVTNCFMFYCKRTRNAHDLISVPNILKQILIKYENFMVIRVYL